MPELSPALSSSRSSAGETGSSSSVLFFVVQEVGECISSQSCKPPLTGRCGQPSAQAGGGFLGNRDMKTKAAGRAGCPQSQETARTSPFQELPKPTLQQQPRVVHLAEVLFLRDGDTHSAGRKGGTPWG